MTDQASDDRTAMNLTLLPLSLRPFFQEYDFASLNLAQHRSLIIERTLAYGNRAEVRWLFQAYGSISIRDWLQRWGARRLPWRRFNLWAVLLDFPPAQRLGPERRGIWPH